LEPAVTPEPDGTFTDVTEQAGLANTAESNYCMGVAVGDYDNDGRPDLIVTQLPHQTYAG
jgi:hypothetical protein